MEGYNKKRHCVYRLNLHIVFVVKHRLPVITEEIGGYILKRAGELMAGWNGALIEGGFEKDHVRLLVSMDPSYEISKHVAAMKQRIAREVRERHPDEVQKYLGNGMFWTTSYFVSSVGETPLEEIREYVAIQGERRPRGRPRKSSVPSPHKQA